MSEWWYEPSWGVNWGPNLIQLKGTCKLCRFMCRTCHKYFCLNASQLFSTYFMICQSHNFQFPKIVCQERFSGNFPAFRGLSTKFPGSRVTTTATLFVLACSVVSGPGLIPGDALFIYGCIEKKHLLHPQRHTGHNAEALLLEKQSRWIYFFFYKFNT